MVGSTDVATPMIEFSNNFLCFTVDCSCVKALRAVVWHYRLSVYRRREIRCLYFAYMGSTYI